MIPKTEGDLFSRWDEITRNAIVARRRDEETRETRVVFRLTMQ